MKIKLTNDNKTDILNDWKNSEINRNNELYFTATQISIEELQTKAFELGLLINVENMGFISKLTFIDILN